MLKDTLNSILDNVKERTTNPFLGTFAVVWTVHNWKVLFSLFNFDPKQSRIDKIKSIEGFFSDTSFILNLLTVVAITIIVLIFTYIMLSLSRLLSDFYDKKVIPTVTKWTDNNAVVLKTDLISLQEEFNKLETRLKDERASRIIAQNERDEAEAKLISTRELEENVVDINEEPKKITSDVNRLFKKIASYVIAEIGETFFNKLIDSVIAYKTIDRSDYIVKYLIRNNVVEVTQAGAGDSVKLSLTDFGNQFLLFWNENHG